MRGKVSEGLTWRRSEVQNAALEAESEHEGPQEVSKGVVSSWPLLRMLLPALLHVSADQNKLAAL